MRFNLSRIPIISIAIILGAFLFFVIGFYWFKGQIADQANKIAADRILIARRNAMLQGLADLKKASVEASVYKQAIDLVLPDQDDLLDFPKWVESSARRANVGFHFSFQGAPTLPTETAAGFISFSLDLNGSLENLRKAMKDLEVDGQKFLVRFDNFDLTKGGEEYRIILRGRVFFK